MFSNFGIENTHAVNKRTIAGATNGFIGIDTDNSTLAYQILTTSRRIRSHQSDSASRRNEKTWAQRNLNSFPDLLIYIPTTE